MCSGPTTPVFFLLVKEDSTVPPRSQVHGLRAPGDPSTNQGVTTAWESCDWHGSQIPHLESRVNYRPHS